MSNAVLYIATGPGSSDGFVPRISHAQVVEGANSLVLDPMRSHKHSNNNSFALAAFIQHAERIVGAKSDPSERVSVCCDSRYVVDGLTTWIKGWEQNGWMSKNHTPIKMKEQWQYARTLLRNLGGVLSYARPEDELTIAYLLMLNTGASPSDLTAFEEREVTPIPPVPAKPRTLLPTQGLW